MPYADPAEQLAAQARWRERNRVRHAEQTRRAKLVQKYGLTLEDYEALLTDQDHRCAICRADSPGGRGAWHVDHCHETGVVRLLLCSRCNRAMGLFRDSPEVMRAAANYLETYSSPSVPED